YGQSGYRDNWSGDLRITLEGSTQVATITFGKISERFTKQGSVWVAAKANGATLAESTFFTYRDADGTQITFTPPTMLGSGNPATISMPSGYCNSSNAINCGVPTEKTDPDGSKYTLTWGIAEQCILGDETTCNLQYRLSDVRSNSGYAMKVKYQSDQGFSGSPSNPGPPPTGWFVRSTLRFFDLSQAFCDPNANNCNSTPGTWPTVTYSTPSTGVFQITNDVAGTWRLDSSVANQFRIRRPSQATDTTIVNYSGGRVSSITNNGETKTYNWTIGATTTVATSTGGGETSTTVSNPAVGQPSAKINGTSNSTTYLYDANNRVTRETRPEGDYTNFTYDARGNVTEVRNVAKPGSGIAQIVTTAGFDASCTNVAKCNKPNFTIDANGNRTDYTYDATTGELTRVQLPAPTNGGTRPEVNYVYSMLSAQQSNGTGGFTSLPAQAKLTQVTSCSVAATCPGSANETKITIAYNNPNLLPTSVTTAAGDGSISSTVAYAYDARDNLTSVDGPLPGSDDTTTYIYDAQDRRRGVIGPDPDGAGARPRLAERYTFDTESRFTKAETGTVTAATEAALNAMTVAQTIDYLYDANGNLIRETVSGTAGAHQITQMTYDSDNRLSCIAQRMNPAVFASLPTSACTLGTPGTGGNDFGADRITQNSYDAAGRVTQVKTALGTLDQANEVTTAYTANGQVAHVIDAENNRTGYIYDGHDRLSQTRYPLPTKGSNAASTADYEQLSYDANSNVTQRRLRDGQLIGFNYDNLNRLTLKDEPNIVTGEFDVTYGYDLLSRLTSMTNASSVPTSLTYDALGRTKTESTNGLTKTMGYDAAGRLTSLAYPGGTLTVNYGYDVTGNVTAIRENGATSGIGVLASYGYDNLGRRSSVTYGNGVLQSYAFNANQRLQTLSSNLAGTAQDQTATLAYNPAGQIDSLTKSNDAYAWNGHYNVDRPYTANGLNQLTSAGATALAYDARGNLNASGSTTYTYTSENRLATVTPTGAGTTLRYDLGGRLWQVVQGANTTRFDYSGSALLSELDGSNTVLRRYVHGPGVDEPIVWYEGSGLGTRRFLTSDERGSVIAVTDNAGSAIATNRYDEYGIPQSTNIGRFQYTGQTWLPEIGMYNYKARIYSPTLGRFLQTDPIGYGDGVNWYNYVGSDPINSNDPSGLSEDCGAGPGDMPCGWEHWPQWLKQSYCDQAKAVGCGIIDPTVEWNGKLYHSNILTSYSEEERIAIWALYFVQDIIVTGSKNPFNPRDYISFIPKNDPEFFSALFKNGVRISGKLKKLSSTNCGNGTTQNAFGFPASVTNGIQSGDVSGIAHAHPSSYGSQGLIPGGKDDSIPMRGVPNIGMTKSNIWVVWKNGGGLNLTLVAGKWPAGFNPSAWIAAQKSSSSGKKGGSICN
ncbi:MAG: RHS repeat-associated core domain-containing protein, partial [Sphingorhabdus sp.]|nr:RHS repeat-associated core domain-containing protein [Sphingorhabdus sp.]